MGGEGGLGGVEGGPGQQTPRPRPQQAVRAQWEGEGRGRGGTAGCGTEAGAGQAGGGGRGWLPPQGPPLTPVLQGNVAVRVRLGNNLQNRNLMTYIVQSIVET